MLPMIFIPDSLPLLVDLTAFAFDKQTGELHWSTSALAVRFPVSDHSSLSHTTTQLLGRHIGACRSTFRHDYSWAQTYLRRMSFWMGIPPAWYLSVMKSSTIGWLLILRSVFSSFASFLLENWRCRKRWQSKQSGTFIENPPLDLRTETGTRWCRERAFFILQRLHKPSSMPRDSHLRSWCSRIFRLRSCMYSRSLHLNPSNHPSSLCPLHTPVSYLIVA